MHEISQVIVPHIQRGEVNYSKTGNWQWGQRLKLVISSSKVCAFVSVFHCFSKVANDPSINVSGLEKWFNGILITYSGRVKHNTNMWNLLWKKGEFWSVLKDQEAFWFVFSEKGCFHTCRTREEDMTKTRAEEKGKRD